MACAWHRRGRAVSARLRLSQQDPGAAGHSRRQDRRRLFRRGDAPRRAVSGGRMRDVRQDDAAAFGRLFGICAGAGADLL